MIYVGEGLQAEEMKVVERGNLEGYLADGWRVLGVAQDSYVREGAPTYGGNDPMLVPVVVPHLVFILGRGAEARDLAAELRYAKDNLASADATADDLRKTVARLENEVETLGDEVKEADQRTQHQRKMKADLSARFEEYRRQVRIVRMEVGEARWREILSSLEVEAVMKEHRAEPADDDLPF